MGVKIRDIITSHSISLDELKGSVIAVDGPNIVMQLVSYSYKNQGHFNSHYMLDRTRRVISHLYGLLYRINFYYSKKIFPIFCFDGRVHRLKRKITKNQLHDFLYVKDQYEEAVKNYDWELAQAIATGKEFMWINTIQESKNLLSYIGIPFIDAPGSAEAQCVQLVKEGFADYVVSQDFDALILGAPLQIQNLSKTGRRKIKGTWQYLKIHTNKIDLKQNLCNLGIDILQLVDLAILIGTDFNEGIKGIGSKIGLRLIKKYGNIETVVKNNRTKYDFSELNGEKLREIRNIFLRPEVIKSHTTFNWNYPQKEKLVEFLCKDDHTLNLERIESNLQKLVINYKRCLDYSQQSDGMSSSSKILV